MEKNVVIVTKNKFPAGDAGSLRLEIFARMLLEHGFEVLVICLGKSTNFETLSYKGINYISLRHNKNTYFSKVLNHILFKKRLKCIMKKKYDYILFTELSFGCIKYFKKLNKLHRTCLIYDCVEWYSACEFKWRFLSYKYFKKNIFNSLIINKNIRVISISNFLDKYYKNKQINSIRIPIIFDEINYENFFKKNDEIINIMYCGVPGKKDNIKIIFDVLYEMEPQKLSKFKFHVVGITKEYAVKNKYIDSQKFSKLKNNLIFYSKIRHEEVLKKYKEVDFTVLIRPSDKRYAQAGFPSKFVESLRMGVPVIANYSSDLHLYLFNNYNGFVVGDYSEEALLCTLNEIAKLSKKEINELKNNSLKSFNNNFYYKKYFNDFIELFK